MVYEDAFVGWLFESDGITQLPKHVILSEFGASEDRYRRKEW